jgi:signal transduction histidine kinase
MPEDLSREWQVDLLKDNIMQAFECTGASTSTDNPVELRRTNDFLAALLGMAGHDLRQPLQVIQSAYDWPTLRSTDQAEKVRLARGERAIAQITRQLDRLIGALHLYEHTRDMELEAVPVAPVLCRIMSENEEAARDKGIDLHVCATRAAVQSNSVLIDSILRNLVRNAIQYTEPGGRILIGCKRQGLDLRIDVYDTGVGIAPENLSRIFEAFRRLNSADTDGLGIGLFVVRRAVELLGHRIEVRSTPRRGSCFSLLARVAG